MSNGAFVELGFDDNLLVNGVGDDLALFELGIPDTFKLSLTIGGLTKSYLSSDTGELAGGRFNLNVAKINLDDFGIPVGGTLDKIVIGLDTVSGQGTVPSLSLVGAINSQNLTAIPEPASTLGLLTLGFLGAASAINRQLSQEKKSKQDN